MAGTKNSGRKKLTDIQHQKNLILKSLKTQYKTSNSKKAEELFVSDWLSHISARELNSKDMALILKYLWTEPSANKEEEQTDDRNINIIVPDYMIRNNKD